MRRSGKISGMGRRIIGQSSSMRGRKGELIIAELFCRSLLEAKREWDPQGVFSGRKVVGSEFVGY
jgi:hypothetical protein